MSTQRQLNTRLNRAKRRRAKKDAQARAQVNEIRASHTTFCEELTNVSIAIVQIFQAVFDAAQTALNTLLPAKPPTKSDHTLAN